MFGTDIEGRHFVLNNILNTKKWKIITHLQETYSVQEQEVIFGKSWKIVRNWTTEGLEWQIVACGHVMKSRDSFSSR